MSEITVSRQRVIDANEFNRLVADHDNFTKMLNQRFLVSCGYSERYKLAGMIKEWCNDNATDLCYIGSTEQTYVYSVVFFAEKDAVAFKLSMDGKAI